MIENKYLEMPSDVLKTHFDQFKEAISKNTEMDAKQFFGEPMTAEQTEKLQNYDSLTSQVKELSTAASAKDLSDNEITLAQASIDRAVSDIRKVDPDAPLGSILDSKFNNLEKLSILGKIEGIVTHYTGAINTIKAELAPTGEETTTQKYSAPKPTEESAADLIKTAMKVE